MHVRALRVERVAQPATVPALLLVRLAKTEGSITGEAEFFPSIKIQIIPKPDLRWVARSKRFVPRADETRANPPPVLPSRA